MKLFDFQKQALEDTRKFKKVAYYFDMGLGKTFMGSEKMFDFDNDVNLLICQKSKIDDWAEHFNKYYEFEIFNLTNQKKLNEFIEKSKLTVEKYILGIINYELIFRRPALLKLENFTLCLDESSLIQNHKSKRSKAILKLKSHSVILLSGTPTSGKYENLWSQGKLLGWEISRKAFEKSYVNQLKLEGKHVFVVDKENPYKNVERLKNKLREYGAVFLKTEDVHDLPKQKFIKINVKKTSEYEKFKKKKYLVIGKNELVGDTEFSFRLYSRMLCGHFNPNKLTAFKDLLESSNERFVVFYNFKAELKALEEICKQLNRPISKLNGDEKTLKNYRNYSNSITLIQYKAGAMGGNFQKATKIIYFTLTESSELFMQSMKRIHRIGQEKPCLYYILHCKNSIEDEVLSNLKTRENLTNDLFKEG